MAMLTIKAKPSVPPPNYAVHDEGEKPGGVIGRDSPRCFYSEVRGWLGAGAGMLWQRESALLYGELYTARLSGGVPGFFVPLLFEFIYSQKMAGL